MVGFSDLYILRHGMDWTGHGMRYDISDCEYL
jgi:hypothetical protein